MKTVALILLLLFSCTSYADLFEQNASYRVCFTPEQNCTDLIVNVINQAKSQILVQAYSFTSAPIAHALTAALKRGVGVEVILDRSQFQTHGFSSAKMFLNYQIPTYIDYQPDIAHNKVMVIVSKTVITGSFNFTRAAQQRNAENVIIITDSNLAKKYIANWKARKDQSELLK
jgi:phosphatidylserine/phosphatidylglycerophosphate/cardiolipin synthase-like enzyme